MPKITALVHTHNDASRIGRLLETLRACDEVLLIDHGSSDATRDVAGEYAATIKAGVPGVSRGVYAIDARHDWILCLLPNEALSETFEAALFEWKVRDDQPKDKPPEEVSPGACSFAVGIREETKDGWSDQPPQTRLVNRTKVNWQDELPSSPSDAEVLAGHILSFRHP